MDRDPQPSRQLLSKNIASASRLLVLHHHSTPRERHGNLDSRNRTLREHAISLGRKLGTAIKVTDEDVWLALSTRKLEKGIVSWMEERPPDNFEEDDYAIVKIYDRKTSTWKYLPKKARIESVLYGPVTQIIEVSLDKFVTPHCGDGVARQVIDTHNIKLLHKEGHRSAPDFIIRATGNSFETPDSGDLLGYSGVATFIDAKIDSALYSKQNIRQMAIYAEQLLAQQPNRMFVRCALVSERRAIILHFDRAGHQVSSFIDIAGRPDRLVHLIVALSSPNEKELGFDTSIQWKIQNGKKVSGTITVNDALSGQKIEYKMANVKPIAHSSGIRGRATTCWAVKDPTDETKELIVKDSWSSQGRIPENEHLAKAKDVKGIARMVAYEKRGIDTKSLRFAGPSGAYFNKYAERIVTERHGPEIHNFTSALQAVEALRSSVIALMELFAKNIIHRDISNRNILLGREGDDDNPRGFIIDLGVALDFGPDRGHSEITKEPRSAARFFEPTISLEYASDLCVDDTPAHDFLDDLEAIFYVLCFLFFVYLPNGKERRKRDPASIVIDDWDAGLADKALPQKQMLLDPWSLRRHAATDIVAQSWGPACAALFESYLDWVYEIRREKLRLIKEFAARKKREEEDTRRKLEEEKEKKDAEEIESESEKMDDSSEHAMEVSSNPFMDDPNNPFVDVPDPLAAVGREKTAGHAAQGTGHGIGGEYYGEGSRLEGDDYWEIDWEDLEGEGGDDGTGEYSEEEEFDNEPGYDDPGSGGEEQRSFEPDGNEAAEASGGGEDDHESDDEDGEILFRPRINIPPLEKGIFASVQEPAENHWNKIISIFDTAIASMKENPGGNGPPPYGTPKKGKERKREYSTEVSPLRARVAKTSRVSERSQPT